MQNGKRVSGRLKSGYLAQLSGGSSVQRFFEACRIQAVPEWTPVTGSIVPLYLLFSVAVRSKAFDLTVVGSFSLFFGIYSLCKCSNFSNPASSGTAD